MNAPDEAECWGCWLARDVAAVEGAAVVCARCRWRWEPNGTATPVVPVVPAATAPASCRDCRETVARVERCGGRWTCPTCGTPYAASMLRTRDARSDLRAVVLCLRSPQAGPRSTWVEPLMTPEGQALVGDGNTGGGRRPALDARLAWVEEHTPELRQAAHARMRLAAMRARPHLDGPRFAAVLWSALVERLPHDAIAHDHGHAIERAAYVATLPRRLSTEEARDIAYGGALLGAAVTAYERDDWRPLPLGPAPAAAPRGPSARQRFAARVVARWRTFEEEATAADPGDGESS